MSRPGELVFEDDVDPEAGKGSARVTKQRFDELTFEDDVAPQQVAPQIDTTLTFEDDPLAQQQDTGSWGQTFKTGLASLTQATLGLSKSLLETPRAASRISRSLEEGWNNSVVDWYTKQTTRPDATPEQAEWARTVNETNLNPFRFTTAVFDMLGEDVELPSLTDEPPLRLGMFNSAADELGRGMELLPELFPSFRRLGVKGQEADAAASALLEGNTELMKKVALDPEAWSAFLANGIPSLFAAWRSGGSIPFMGWLEGMDAAQNAQDFEKRTGVQMSDSEFATATLTVGATNAFLEKFGLDTILGKYGKTRIGQLIAGFAGEGGTEALQELTNNTAALMYDPELQAQAREAIDEGEWEPFLKRMSQGIVPAMMGGTALGGTASSARVALESLSERNRADRIRSADITPEQAAEAGLAEVPVTYDLLERVATGQPLNENEQYTVLKQQLGRFANDDRIVLVKEGLAKRAELTPQQPAGEHIVMEGDEFTTVPVEIEEVTDDVDRRVTFSMRDQDGRRRSRQRLDRGANYAATSDLNELPGPTDAQVEAGNYRKGHVRVQGLEISIESPKGSVREGPNWQQKMADHYGYIRGTVGKDKDHIDTFLGPNAYSQQVYVVNQNKPDGTFDEHKVILGYTSKADAEAAYHANYPPGWKGMGSIVSLGMDEFKEWLGSDRTKQPIVERKPRDELQDLAPIANIKSVPTPSEESRATATQQYDEQASQGPFTTRDGRTVKLTKVGIKKARSHAADPNVLAIVPHLGALIESSVPVKSVNRESTDRGDSIRAYHHYAGKVMIGGKHHFVKVTLREAKDGSVIFYDTDVTPGEQMMKPPKGKGFSLAAWWQKDLVTEPKVKFKTKPAKTNAGEGVNRHTLRAAVNILARYFKAAPDLEVVEGFEDLPEHIRSRVTKEERGLITGVYDQEALTETVYLIANNIDSIEQGIETLLHEYVGHYGLRAILGDSYNEMMDRVYERFDSEVREAARVQGLDWQDLEQRRVAAEEFIAYTAQRYLRKESLPEKALKLLRQFIEELKRIVDLAMGKPDSFTERQLADLIQQAYDYVHNPSGYVRAQRRGARRNMENPVFYSQFFKLINDDKAKAMSPEDWVKLINGHVASNRLKEEELRWTDVRERLADMKWSDALKILADMALPLDSLAPVEVVKAWREMKDSSARYEKATEDFNQGLRDYGESSFRDPQSPNYARMRELFTIRDALDKAADAAEDAWSPLARQVPKRLPKEIVLALIKANGVEIIIDKKTAESGEQQNHDFDEDSPDEEEGSDDDMMEAWSTYESDNFDQEMYDEQLIWELKENISDIDWKVVNKIDEESGEPVHDEELAELDDSEIIELAKEYYEQRRARWGTEWDRIEEKAQEQYHEAFENANYSDFTREWERDHKKATWYVGHYTVTLQGREYTVYNGDGGYEVGTYRSASRATDAMNEDAGSEDGTAWAQYTLPDSTDYEEWLLRWNQRSGKNLYQSGHWSDSENVLAHVRFDVRKDAAGNPAIFIDEIQSDWHQALRDEGEKASQREIDQLERSAAQYRAQYRAEIEGLRQKLLSWDLDPEVASVMPTEAGPLRARARDMLGNLGTQIRGEQNKTESDEEHYEEGVLDEVHLQHKWNPTLTDEANRERGWDGTTAEAMSAEAKAIIKRNPFDPDYETVVEYVRRDDGAEIAKANRKKRHKTTWRTFVEEAYRRDYEDLLSGTTHRDRTPMNLASLYTSLAPTLVNSVETQRLLGEALVRGDMDEATRTMLGQRIADGGSPVFLPQQYSLPLARTQPIEAPIELGLRLRDIALELHEREEKLERSGTGIAAAPFAKTWQLLVIKAMIREAVDRGHKSIFMAPGEVHGVRWSGGTSTQSIVWHTTTVEVIKLDERGKKIELQPSDPKYVAGEVVYDYEEVPGYAISPRGGATQFIPVKKLASVVGLDVAALIHERAKTIPIGADSELNASEVGRTMIFLPNGQRDTLSGGREIYNVITPNLINKFVKKFGAEMKLGVVKGEVSEAKGVKPVQIPKTSPYAGYTIRQLTPAEVASWVNQGETRYDWYAAFQRDGDTVSVAHDSINLDRDQVERWLKDRIAGSSFDEGFEAWEIKITDKLRDAANGGFPLFMKKYPSKKLNDAMRWADKNIGPRGPSTVKRLQQRANEVVNISNKAAKIEQAFVDQFAGLKYALLQTYGVELPAERSSYKQAHFTTGIDSQMYAFLNHGVPTWKNGITAIKDGSKGLLEILEPVAAHIDEWGMWMAARRADRLMGEGREHLFGREEIEGLLELSKYHPEFIGVAVEFAKWKAEFLDWAQEGGTIDPTTRQLWENADYVPFFRIKADELGGSFSRSSNVGAHGLANQFNPIKRLKGGTQPLGNILENIIMNFTHIASTTMKNRAAALAVENLEGTGIIEPVKGSEFLHKEIIDMGDLKRKLKAAGVDWRALDEEALHAMRQMWTVQPPKGDDIISVLIGGKKKYFHVNDELVFRSLTAINTNAFNSTFAKIMMAPFRRAKRFVTSMITLAPDFIASNVVRDSLSAFIISRHEKFPRFDQTALGAWKAFVDDKEMISMMAAGGAFYAGYVNALDPASTAKAVKRSMRDAGFRRTILNSPKKLFDAYQRIASASENASRIGMSYIPAIKAGKSEAEAIWQAKDLMNFAKHGDNAVMQFLIQTVPFMNARIQGLVRTGQRFKEAPGITAFKGILLMAAALALWLSNKDDDRYKELTDDDKDLYFHFWLGDEHYRLPKPFEVGMIFATFPERIMEYFMSNEDDAGKHVLDRTKFVFDQVFMLYDPVTIVPMPALIEPLVEVNLNQNFFWQAPIVPEYMQDIALVKPDQVYDDTTSPTMRELAKVAPRFLPNSMRNPMMLEHLAQAYGGTLTSYAVMMSDDLVRQAYDYPPRPKLMWSQMPVVGRFYRGTEPPRRTGYENIMYQVRQNARAVERAVNQMEDRELVDEAEAFMTEPSEYNRRFTNEQIIEAARDMEPIYNSIRQIRKEMNEIWTNGVMTPEEKLNRLNDLYREKADEAREAYRLRPGASQEEEIGPILQLNQIIDNIRGLKPDDAIDELRARELNSTAELVAGLPRVTSASFAKVLRDA